MMNSEGEKKDITYNEEQGQAPPPDAFAIEELDDPEESASDENVHDQLPNVEEYKASNAIQSHTSSKKTFLLALAILSLASAITAGIVVAVKNNKKDKIYSPVGRTKEVEEFLFTNQVSTLPQLQEINSPQHRAAAFVADGDSLHMSLNEKNSRRFVERYVLSLLYYQFNGPAWNFGLKFLSGVDHCEWYDDFKTAAGDLIRQGVICNEDKHVVKLNLAWNNLKGTSFPREIGYLGDLETLHMYYNDLGGYFPSSFRHMTNLREIGLMKAGLVGSLPDWIGEMTQLTTLGLGDNAMYGEIPDSIENLRNLRILGLDGNGGISGSIEKLKKLSSLEALYLENNALTGNLLNFNWPKLLELDVSNNMLDERVPVELFNHPTLQVVDIHKNMMFGAFPDDLFENTKLEYLSAHNSGFSGTIPDRLAFLKNLKHLDISFNGLTGTIPDTLIQLTQLHYWATSGNKFSSQPMLDLSKMSNLLDLSMKNNNLIGNIPGWIGNLQKLQLLDLDSNELTGSIPSAIGSLRELDFLLLNRNKFSGSLPTQMKNLVQLQVLLLDGNSISGNANAICDNDSDMNIGYFIADCYPGLNGERPEIECRCCTQCCTDEDPTCNDKEWTSSVDPIWEYGYVRPKYSFKLENAPASYSKQGDGDGADTTAGGGL